MLKKFFVCLLIPLLLVFPVRAEGAEPVHLPIVMYHHISRNPKYWNDYVVSPAEFEADLVYLKEHGYETISVRELLAWQAGEYTMPEKPCMITFDDGFESTEAYAEPLLNQYGFCGVVAVIGSVCEEFSVLDEHDPELSNMSWEDVRAMAERGTIEVQCHTWDMHELRPRSGCGRMRGETVPSYRRTFSADLSRFLTACREHGVDLVPTIAYPYGCYDEETSRAVQDMDFRAAFTCTEKINILTGDREELYDLGRYNRPHGVSTEKFFKNWEEM